MVKKLLRATALVGFWSVFVIVIFAGFAYQHARCVDRTNIEAIEAHVSEKLQGAIEGKKIGCAAFGIIDEGRIRPLRGFGYAKPGDQSPVDPDTTLFLVASVSKALTAWGVMKLVQDGKLSLDEPVINYLSRWKFAGSENYGRIVTVRHLLSHTAGIVNDPGSRGFLPGEEIPTLEETLAGAVDPRDGQFHGAFVTREPGTTMDYSGSGYTILQLLIEEVTGGSFALYMSKQILEPLGMRGSTFELEDIQRQDRTDHLASAYDHKLGIQPHRRYTAQASVSLYCPAQDLATFALAFITKNPVLTEHTIHQMTLPQPGTGGTWGLGLANFQGKNYNIVGHDGGTIPAWGAWFRVNPATRNGFIMMISGGRGAVNEVVHDWMYWETGEVSFGAWRQNLFDMIFPLVATIILGSIIILAVIWWR